MGAVHWNKNLWVNVLCYSYPSISNSYLIFRDPFTHMDIIREIHYSFIFLILAYFLLKEPVETANRLHASYPLTV